MPRQDGFLAQLQAEVAAFSKVPIYSSAGGVAQRIALGVDQRAGETQPSFTSRVRALPSG